MLYFSPCVHDNSKLWGMDAFYTRISPVFCLSNCTCQGQSLHRDKTKVNYPLICTFGSICTGPCCDEHICRFKRDSIICRPAQDHCDFEERCTGNSSQCPEDRYRLDGTPCVQRGRSFCTRGVCNTANMFCHEMFTDETTTSGTKFCYDNLCK